jgi:hypothetical protein
MTRGEIFISCRRDDSAGFARAVHDQQADGLPRLFEPTDFVRLEIASALGRDVRVMPVLLDGAAMPTEAELPEELKPLARRNAIEISNSRFAADIDAQGYNFVLRHDAQPAPNEQRDWRFSGRIQLRAAVRLSDAPNVLQAAHLLRRRRRGRLNRMLYIRTVSI